MLWAAIETGKAGTDSTKKHVILKTNTQLIKN